MIEGSPNEADESKYLIDKGHSSMTKAKQATQTDLIRLNAQTGPRVGSPKSNTIERLRSIFKRDVGYKSPPKDPRLGSINNNNVQTLLDRTSMKSSLHIKRTDEALADGRHPNIRSRKRLCESRLNKDYKSMNNLRIDLTRKHGEIQLNSRKSSPKLVNLTQITSSPGNIPLNLFGPINNNVLLLEEKNAQLEIRVSELVLQNTQLLKKVEALEKDLKASDDKNKVSSS